MRLPSHFGPRSPIGGPRSPRPGCGDVPSGRERKVTVLASRARCGPRGLPRVFLAVAWLLVATLALAGQTFYVTDELEITLRSGPGLGYKILAMLKTGTPLEKLAEQEGWAQVRTPDGQEGWVVARYLSGDPPKGPRLEAAERELARLRQELADLKARASDQAEEAGAQRRRADAAERELAKIRKEFAEWKEAHKDAATLKARADAMEAELTAARDELGRLRARVAHLETRERFYWFFSGALVLLAGWILGYLYAASRHKAKAKAKFRFY